MNLPRYEQFFAFNEDGMPDEETVMETVRQVILDLQALRVAPVAEPYSGPAILSGRASGVFFHEILGHRVEGHRQREADDAQTFKDMIGESVLPDSFSVVFDPTIRHAGGTDLAGSFRFDNEGVKGQRVVVIDQGLLQGVPHVSQTDRGVLRFQRPREETTRVRRCGEAVEPIRRSGEAAVGKRTQDNAPQAVAGRGQGVRIAL